VNNLCQFLLVCVMCDVLVGPERNQEKEKRESRDPKDMVLYAKVVDTHHFIAELGMYFPLPECRASIQSGGGADGWIQVRSHGGRAN
jgi:hypothetical protein